MNESQIAALQLVAGYGYGHTDPKTDMIVMYRRIDDHDSQLSLLADIVIDLSQKVNPLLEQQKSAPPEDGS